MMSPSYDSAPIEGPGLILGSDVNTDVLHPSRFYSLRDDTVRSGFLGALEGDLGQSQDEDQGSKIVVAGSNFGCGSSRETGARVFLLAGVKAVIAGSFARIFHRNLINLGMPTFTCPAFDTQGVPPIKQGEALRLDLRNGQLRSPNAEWQLAPLDPLLGQILIAGGLIPFLEQT